MNLMGCKIAASVYLDTTDITEHDCVTIGAHGRLNALCCPQTHLFEDRVMKIDHIVHRRRDHGGARCHCALQCKRWRRCTARAADPGDEGETLPARTRWEGAPAAPARPHRTT